MKLRLWADETWTIKWTIKCMIVMTSHAAHASAAIQKEGYMTDDELVFTGLWSDSWPIFIDLCERFSVSSTASFWLPIGACFISFYLQFKWNVNIYAKLPFADENSHIRAPDLPSSRQYPIWLMVTCLPDKWEDYYVFSSKSDKLRLRIAVH